MKIPLFLAGDPWRRRWEYWERFGNRKRNPRGSKTTSLSFHFATRHGRRCFRWRYTCFITPHVTLWRVGYNSFDIVCVSVCVSVCVCVRLTLTAKRMDIQTWISVCRSSGRISRSSLKVKVIGQRSRSLGQKTFFRVANSVWNWIHSTPYMNGRATTWGVFKAYAFFLLFIFEPTCYRRSLV